MLKRLLTDILFSITLSQMKHNILQLYMCGDPGLRGSDPQISSHRRLGTSLKTRVQEVCTLWFEFDKATYTKYILSSNSTNAWAVFSNTVQVFIQRIYTTGVQIVPSPVIKQGKWQFYFTGTRSKLTRICVLFMTGGHIVTLKILCNRVDGYWKYI